METATRVSNHRNQKNSHGSQIPEEREEKQYRREERKCSPEATHVDQRRICSAEQVNAVN
jgi:hypothetical protein